MQDNNATAAQPGLDPTIKSVELTLGGKTYHLVFTFQALATAKAKLRALKPPVEINMLRSLDFRQLDVDTIPGVLFGAIQMHHPDASYEDLVSAIDMRNVTDVYVALSEAYVNCAQGSDAEKGAANPPLEQS